MGSSDPGVTRHNSTVTVRKLAAIYPKGKKYFAKILYENALEPVDLFRLEDTPKLLHAHLLIDFMNMEIVTRREFELELDHIRLFGCRSHDKLVLDEDEKPKDNKEVIDFFLDDEDMFRFPK